MALALDNFSARLGSQLGVWEATLEELGLLYCERPHSHGFPESLQALRGE